ncbi:MAG: DUF4097 family beta strand repeat protein [Clostridia bacterium]|nr:DUF4097 family beta strand repeat protein [Clostridia bacterium]
MNNKVVLKIVVICLAVFVVFGIIASIFIAQSIKDGLDGDGEFLISSREPFEYHKNDVFDLDGITKVNIITVSSDVTFYESEEQLEITLDCYGYTSTETVTLETEKIGSVINAKVKYPQMVFGNLNITDSQLRVGIPADYAQDIKISGVSSDVSMESFLKNSFAELEVGTVSGDINIYCTQVDTLDITTTSGNITSQETVLGKVLVNTTSGDVELSNIDSEDNYVNVNTVSGSVNLHYDVLCETHINTTSGDISLTMPEDSVMKLDFDSVSGDINGEYSTNSAGTYVNIDTVSGDLNMN